MKASIASNAQSGSSEHKGCANVVVSEEAGVVDAAFAFLNIAGFVEGATDKQKK